jgi:hypothetical protein
LNAHISLPDKQSYESPVYNRYFLIGRWCHISAWSDASGESFDNHVEMSKVKIPEAQLKFVNEFLTNARESILVVIMARERKVAGITSTAESSRE